MNKTISAEERLRRNSVVATRIDYGIAACMVAAPVLAFTLGLAHMWGGPEPLWVRVAAAFFAGMIVSYPAVKVLAALGRLATAKFAPSWVVDASDPAVVRVHGAISLDQWSAAKSSLLRARPGYEICDDAAGRFGCTMAAVPSAQ